MGENQAHAGWDRRVWMLAGPIILSNLSVPLLGAVDTAVMGHLPDPLYLGAVAIGAMVFSFLYWGFGFLRMGTTGLVAQAWGRRDIPDIQANLYRGLIVAIALSLAILLLQAPVLWLSMTLLEASGPVEAAAARYYEIRVWGAPAALANYVILGWFLGMQDARMPLVIQLVTNGVNIILDIWFVMGLGWDVGGVAAATVIAEYSGVALGGWLIWRRLQRLGIVRLPLAQLLDRAELAHLFALNRDIMIRTLCLIFGFAYFTAKGAEMGDAVLAANAVLMNFMHFTAYGLDGFAHAAEALVGGAVGQRDRSVFRAAVRASMKWAAIIALVMASLFWFAGEGIIELLTSIDSVRAEALSYLIWPALMPLISIWCFTYDGIFLGATRGADLRNGMLVSVAGYQLAVHLLMPVYGNHGLWAAMVIFMGLRGATLAIRYPVVDRELQQGP